MGYSPFLGRTEVGTRIAKTGIQRAWVLPAFASVGKMCGEKAQINLIAVGRWRTTCPEVRVPEAGLEAGATLAEAR